MREYQIELNRLRAEFGGGRGLPKVSFFLFGMGNRPKLLYRDGELLDARTGKIVRQWKVESQMILPPFYSVFLKTSEGDQVVVREEERGIFIEQNGHRELVEKSDTPVKLPDFAGYAYPQVMRVLLQEILVNVVDTRPLPNCFVYKKPWYRDGAMMAMCLKASGNLDLIRPWVKGLDEPFDRNNGGETEADNPGEALYLISLCADKDHPLVPRLLEALHRFEVRGPQGLYIKGHSDFADRPMYQTKWAKFGLRALSLPDPYTLPKLSDEYSSLFWMDYRDAYVAGHDASDEHDYPYLGWASDHFHGHKHGVISANDYPLTWEANASQADYGGMRIISPELAERKIATPHTWHAAEVLLYLLDRPAKT